MERSLRVRIEKVSEKLPANQAKRLAGLLKLMTGLSRAGKLWRSALPLLPVAASPDQASQKINLRFI